MAGEPDATYLIAGLGNPGPKYAANRHNIGFMVADRLAESVGGRSGASADRNWKRHGKARALVCEGRLGPGRPRVILVKPLTFMNLSGQAVAPLAAFYKVPAERIVAVHDELDIPFGSVRLKSGGGEGGHNGLRSLSQTFGTRDYARVRCGVGRPTGRMDAAAYVLRDFSTAERPELSLVIETAADAAVAVVETGLTAAQNRFHSLN